MPIRSEESAGRKMQTLRERYECTEEEARSSLEQSSWDVEDAEKILKAKGKKETRYTGGNVSGQIVEMPGNENKDLLDTLIKKSDENKEKTKPEKGVRRMRFVVYKDGVLTGETFHPMRLEERDRFLKRMKKTGEIPSDLLGIKQGEFVDLDFSMKMEENYPERMEQTLRGKEPDGKAKEKKPGYDEKEIRRKKILSLVDSSGEIRVGLGGAVFKIVIDETKYTVRMGKNSKMREFIEFLREKGISAGDIRICSIGQKYISESEDSKNFDKTLLVLQ